MNEDHVALIVGSTGIVGGNLATLLREQGWAVYGLARRPSSIGGVLPLAADLRDRQALAAALDGITPTHAFFCTVAQATDRSRECRGKRRNDREPVRGAGR